MKAKRLKQRDVRRLARCYVKWWAVRPFEVRRKMRAVEKMAIAMAGMSHGELTRTKKAVARDAAK